MRARKSASDWSNEGNYPGILHKLCKEEDVLIIPQFVTVYVGRHYEHISPRKSKDSRIGDKYSSNLILPSESSKDECEPQPPQIGIVYESPEEREGPVAVICKNIYIEYTFINAFGKSLKPFPTLSTLKIENCCISKDIAEALALLLAEEPGRQITDLSLNGNEGIAEVLQYFFSFPNGLRILSLQRCSLGNDDIKSFASSLGHLDEKDHKLQVLDLGMNKIQDGGILHLANALRTNRALVSLSLPGNQIGDEGVAYLTEVLMKFRLTYEEVVFKRRRIFDAIMKKKNALEKYVEERKQKGEVESQTSKMSSKSTDRGVRKIRGIDGKLRCLSSRDKRGKANQTKMNSGEKFRGKIRNGTEEIPSGVELSPSELLAIAQQVDSEMPPDKHPFVNEVTPEEDGYWCEGCLSIANINLAYNYLTEKSVEKFTKVLIYQHENFKSPTVGLRRLIILPGNSIQENSDEFQKLQSTLILHNSKKEVSEMSDPVPVGSISSARRMSSSTRKIKNR